jgi:hypothetical protein
MPTWIIDTEPGAEHGVFADGAGHYLVVKVEMDGTAMTITPVMGPFDSFGAAFSIAQEMG